MPVDPNQGVIRSGQYPSKPSLEESESGQSIWITTDDEDDPVLVVSLMNCTSILVAQKRHIDEIEAAEREGMAELERIREREGAMGPEYPEYPEHGDEPTP